MLLTMEAVCLFIGEYCVYSQYISREIASLISCSAMGRSRSATIVLAYTMQKFHISPLEALAQLRESRGVCDPNDGFKKQLELYHQMQMPKDVESDPIYQRWLYKREVDLSLACGQAPEAQKIRFEDEHTSATEKEEEGAKEFRCRKCRYYGVIRNSHL